MRGSMADTERYDSFDELENDYGDSFVGAEGETLQQVVENAYDKLPTNAVNVGEYLVTDEQDHFLFLGFETEEQSGGLAYGEDVVEDTLEPR